MAAKRFTDQVGIQQQNLSTGFTQGANTLLNRLESFKRSTNQLTDVIEAKRGEEEAKLAIAEGKPFEKKEAGIFEKVLTGGVATAQYNKSLETAYLAGLGNDAKEAINAIEAENTSDIAAFNDKARGYVSGVLKTVDPSVKDKVAEFLDGQVTNSRLRVHRNTIKKNKADAAAESAVAVTSFGNESARLAREGNQVGSAEQIVNAYETIDGMVASGDLAADRAFIMKREINREASEQTNRKKFDDLIQSKGPQEAEKVLNEIKGKAPKGWTPDEWQTYTNSQQADINRQIAKQNAAAQEVEKQAQIALRQYESAVSLGFEVSPEEKIKVKELVAGTPQQEQFDRINRTASFSLLSNADRAAELNKLETGELDNVADFSAMLKANSEINKAAMKDGYALGVQQGLVDLVPFDPADPQSMAARATQADSLSAHYGVPVSPLTDAEADNLSNSINEMTVPEKVQLATTLNESPAVWGQISAKNQPAFAMAGATGDTTLMATVFKGQELLAAKLVDPPKRADYLPVLDEFVGDVYGVQDKAAILEATKNHYAATADDGGVFDQSKFEESLSAVTGGIGEINGFKVELPRGTTEDTFDDFIDAFTPAQVEKLGGVMGFTNEQAAELIQTGRIKNVGANKYVLMANDTQALFKPDGKPLTIEWTEQAMADIEAERFIKRQTISDSLSSLRSF